MFGLIFVLLFVAALVVSCVALLRSSANQKRRWGGPSDLRRADDAEKSATFDDGKAYRAAQDSVNRTGGPYR